MGEKTSLQDRIIKNWKTTIAAVIPAIVAVGVWLGTDIDPGAVGKVLGGIYVVLLLLSRDYKE